MRQASLTMKGIWWDCAQLMRSSCCRELLRGEHAQGKCVRRSGLRA